MLDSVNIHSPVAVYLQIENQVKFAIARKELKPGDRLPAVQELAKRLDINFNTVSKAYRDLEVMGLIFTRRGMGCFIRDDAYDQCKTQCYQDIVARLHEVTQEAKAAGMTKKDLTEFLNAAFKSDGPVYGDVPKSLLTLAKKK